ncbi:MAG: hypothetical protein OXN79_11645 [bacterium]|nr:hypothetical protein [bacterium]MDE0217214.1 hypothetical protein [bacterium]
MEAIEPIEVQRDRCHRHLDVLRDLTRIHVEIDPPTRQIGADEPDWVFRLRKVCLHALAITMWEVNADAVHVIAVELRAAYQQMDVVWKCLPDQYRFAEDGSWWPDHARSGLAAYDHPTMLNLELSLDGGGFSDAEDPRSYLQLALWLGQLGCAYGLALGYLAQVLGAEGDIDSRLGAILTNGIDLPRDRR